MSLETNPKTDASLGDLTADLSAQLSRLVRDEMCLAQKEFQESAKHAGIGAGQLGDTVDALTAKVDRSKAAAKPSLAVVASVAGATVVGIVWWRRRSRWRAG